MQPSAHSSGQHDACSRCSLSIPANVTADSWVSSEFGKTTVSRGVRRRSRSCRARPALASSPRGRQAQHGGGWRSRTPGGMRSAQRRPGQRHRRVRYLRELLIALPKARTADDYKALLPWRLTSRAAPHLRSRHQTRTGLIPRLRCIVQLLTFDF